MKRTIPRRAPTFRPSFNPPASFLLARPSLLSLPLPYSQQHQQQQRKAFSTSHPRRDGNNEAPRSPFAVFVETLKGEIEKNRDLQENVKQLQGDVGKMQDSEQMKRAKELYEKARITTILRENPKLQEAADQMKRSGVKVSEAVAEALKQVEESAFLRGLNKTRDAVSSSVAAATAPVRNTEAYKVLAESVSEVFDDSGALRYGGYAEKEVRRKRRQARLEKLGRMGMGVGSRVKANDEAGAALVLSKEASKPPSRWETMKQTSPLFQKAAELREAYDESESPVISKLRSVTEWIGSFSEENEMAQVTRRMRYLDPSFDVEGFAKDLREYIIPEVLDAYLMADKEALKLWCGEAAYSMLWATMEQYRKQGLQSESRVVDINHVDVSTGKMLDNETPVLLVSFATQEILTFRHIKTGEVMVGKSNKVEGVRYAAVFTRVEDELEDEVTGGWKLLEMARRGNDL